MFRVRLHLTNVVGAGASQLLESLLPAIERDSRVIVERIELPDRGKLRNYHSNNPQTVVQIYRRRLPNIVSRALECTFWARRFDGDSPLLVLGDLPLRCRGPQTVFVQTTKLVKERQIEIEFNDFKYWFARFLFRISIGRVKAFIVQTDVMRDALEQCYPGVVGKVHVIAQPVPSWLMYSGLKRLARTKEGLLNLIYPAAGYPHKNHTLLSRLDLINEWPVEQLVITIDPSDNPSPNIAWLKCCGFLSSEAMIEAYSNVDALLFLSKEESFGFPLVEAMFVGLPIICPDLLYARALCGDQAIYFHPDRPESLRQAIDSLYSRLKEGWWPNWSEYLDKFPKDWEDVARRMLEVACENAVEKS